MKSRQSLTASTAAMREGKVRCCKLAALLLFTAALAGCGGIERAQKSPLYPATLTVGTANHSETGKIVGVGASLTWNLK